MNVAAKEADAKQLSAAQMEETEDVGASIFELKLDVANMVDVGIEVEVDILDVEITVEVGVWDVASTNLVGMVEFNVDVIELAFPGWFTRCVGNSG